MNWYLFLTSIFVLSCGAVSGEDSSGSSAGECDAKSIPAEPAAAGQLVLSVGGAVNPCDVKGYVVGYKDLLKVEHSNDGKIFIDDVPSGDHDIILTTGSLSINLTNASNGKGKRLGHLKFLNGKRTDVGEVELPELGSISGKVTLSGQQDHAGIDIYIPGTSYIAKSDLNGSYSLDDIPVGTHNLHFERAGYYKGVIENIDVASDTDSKPSSVTLFLSEGANPGIIIDGGATKSIDYDLDLVLTNIGESVLMKISDEASFVNKSWVPLSTSTSFKATLQGLVTVYVLLADENGLESGPFSANIYITGDETDGNWYREQWFGERCSEDYEYMQLHIDYVTGGSGCTNATCLADKVCQSIGKTKASSFEHITSGDSLKFKQALHGGGDLRGDESCKETSANLEHPYYLFKDINCD